MSLEPVQIDFQAGGVRDVLRAFDTIERTAERAERGMARSAGAGSRERVVAVKREADDREKALAKLAREAARWEKEAVRDAERGSRQRSQAAEKEASAETKELAKVWRAREKASQDAVRLREREAHDIERIAQRQAQSEERAAQQLARVQQRAAATRVRANRGFGSSLVRTAGSAIGGVASGAMMLGGAALALGGGFGMADALRSGMNEEKAAVSLYNSLPNAEQGKTSIAGIQARGRAIQAATHIDKASAIAAMQDYVAKTGDASLLAPGDKTAIEIAKLSKATGSDFGNLMSTAGLEKAQNPNMSSSDLLETLRITAAQGMKGSVELKDLASIGGKITSSRGAYAGNQTDVQRKLLGLAQVVAPVSAGPEEAATIVNRFTQMSLKNSAALAAIDPSLVDKKSGRLGDMTSIITGVLGATGGNLGKIQAAGYKMESLKLFEQLAPTYQEAFDKAGGAKGGKGAVEAGKAAVAKQIGDITGSSMSEKDVDDRLARVLEEKTEKIDAAMQRLEEVLADKGMPILERLIDKLPELLPKIEAIIDGGAKLAGWFASNPFLGLGAIIAGAVAKDLAGMGLSKLITTAVQSLLTQGTPGVNGGIPTPGAAAGNFGAAVAGVAVPIAVLGAQLSAQAGASFDAKAGVGQLDADVKGGKVSPEEAQRQVKAAQERLNNITVMGGHVPNAKNAAALYTLASGVDELTGGNMGAREKLGQIQKDRALVNSDQLAKDIHDAVVKGASGAIIASSGGSVSDSSHPSRNKSIPQQTHQ